MVYPKDSARVRPGYDCTPASPPTYTAGQSGVRPSGHSLGVTNYFPVQVAQAPGATMKYHPAVAGSRGMFTRVQHPLK